MMHQQQPSLRRTGVNHRPNSLEHSGNASGAIDCGRGCEAFERGQTICQSSTILGDPPYRHFSTIIHALCEPRSNFWVAWRRKNHVVGSLRHRIKPATRQPFDKFFVWHFKHNDDIW